MAKVKIAFVCTECGAEYSKWQGQCNQCGEWSCISEFRQSKASSTGGRVAGFAGTRPEIQPLDQISLESVPRIRTSFSELDRVLGGGLVHGSAILIGGNPGAGKSTLLLQVTCELAKSRSVLYVTGEESLQQVAMRAARLGLKASQLQLFSETSVEQIVLTVEANKPAVLVVDSIQVMHTDSIESAPGSVSQVRECAAYLTRMAKQTGTILILVGHVTKDGTIAGPKVLEHMIDCSLMLEGDEDNRFRTLRSIKNRFGAVNELGVFAMMESGLKEVKNPSAIFLNRGAEKLPGSVVTVFWEGTRPLLVEIQALVDDASAGYPKRVAVGLDQNRMSMLLAILNKHAGLHCTDQDVFLNVVGGLRANETSADLAALAAVISSFRERALPEGLIVLGEVGLSGEIRPVSSGQERIAEAAKHGFTQAIVPFANMPRQPIKGIEVKGIKRLAELLELI